MHVIANGYGHFSLAICDLDVARDGNRNVRSAAYVGESNETMSLTGSSSGDAFGLSPDTFYVKLIRGLQEAMIATFRAHVLKQVNQVGYVSGQQRPHANLLT